jgi:hypothetical protein
MAWSLAVGQRRIHPVAFPVDFTVSIIALPGTGPTGLPDQQEATSAITVARQVVAIIEGLLS